MRPPMRHIAYKVTTTRNAYGDYVQGSQTALTCHFRDISNITIAGNETYQSDAMGWFEPDADISKGDVFLIKDEGYIVERVTKARRLWNPSIQFIKVEFMKYGIIS